METRIRLVRNPNITTGDIDIEFEVTESEKYYVESINIEGNTKTKSIVILRELALAPGMVFDSVRMKTSQLRLENTQFFEEVNVVPESTNIPQRKNLKISVKEGRTGNLTFGAGFSSLERAVVFVELTQGNFDLFNRRSFFQGDGQLGLVAEGARRGRAFGQDLADDRHERLALKGHPSGHQPEHQQANAGMSTPTTWLPIDFL